MRNIHYLLAAGALFLTICPLADAQLASSPWPSYGGDVRNTHCSTLGGASGDVRVLWEYACPGGAHYQPVLATDGTILFTTYSSDALIALTPSGQLLWQQTASRINSWPAVDASDRVFYATWPNNYTTGRTLAAKHVSDGQTAWSSPLPTPAYIQSGPTVSPDGTLYIGHQQDSLYAFSPDGQMQWTGLGGGYLVTPAIAPNGDIVTGKGWSVQATSSAGQPLWSYPTTGNAASVAIATNGTIYAGSRADTVGGREALHALSPTGQLLWSFNGAGGSPSIGPDGTIYAGHTNTLYAIAPDGTEKWRYDVGFRGDQSVSSEGVTIDAGGNVYVTNAQGILMSLDPQGQLRWTLDLAPDTTENIYPSIPIIGADGVLYVGTGYGDTMVAVIPEPATLGLLGLGGVALIRRRRRHK